MKKLEDKCRQFFEENDRLRRWIGRMNTPTIIRKSVPTVYRRLKGRVGWSRVCCELLKQLHCLPQEWDEPVSNRKRVTTTSPVSITEGEHRYHVSHGDDGTPETTPPREVLEAAQMLSDVAFKLDPWMVDFVLSLRSNMQKEKDGIKTAEDWLPTRMLEEMEIVGTDTYYLPHSILAVGSYRFFPDTEGSTAPLFNKAARACTVLPRARKVNDKAQSSYRAWMAREYGLDTDAKIDDVLVDPEDWVQNHGGTPLGVAACRSWRQIETTGKTPFLQYEDASKDGYSQQMAMLRERELLVRANVLHPHHEPPTIPYASALRSQCREFLGQHDIATIIKQIASPAMIGLMYAGGGKAVYGTMTKAHGKQCSAHKIEADMDEIIPIPPIMEEWEAMQNCTTPEDRARLFLDQCKIFTKVYRRRFKRSVECQIWWEKKWKESIPESGFWPGLLVPHPFGGVTLVPHLRRQKETFDKIQSEWFEGDIRVKEYEQVSAWFEDPDGGAALAVGGAQVKDLACQVGTIRHSKGGVKVSVHDSVGFHPADREKVQKAGIKGFNEAHAIDVMETGRKQVLLPETGERYR